MVQTAKLDNAAQFPNPTLYKTRIVHHSTQQSRLKPVSTKHKTSTVITGMQAALLCYMPHHQNLSILKEQIQ